MSVGSGGRLKPDVSATKGTLQVRWLNISRSAWLDPQTAQGGKILELKSPSCSIEFYRRRARL